MKGVQNSKSGGNYATSAGIQPVKKTSNSLPAGLSEVRSRLRQECLDFGSDEVHDLLHGQHSGHVFIGHKFNDDWKDESLETGEARAYAHVINGFPDYYHTMNAFAPGRKHTIERLTALTACFVDLDTYNIPGLANIAADDLLDLIREVLPWIPVPTVLFNSGRGVYFCWTFDKPLSADYLHIWQPVQDALVELLEPWGADWNAKDAARFLRIVGTINSKSGETVTARQAGEPVKFERLRVAVLDALRERSQSAGMVVNPAAESICEPVEGPKRTATARQKAQGIDGYKLARDRADDYRTLARLRAGAGGLLEDYRHRLLFCFAVSAAWFRPSRAAVIEECRGFALEHFKEPAKYSPARIGKILEGVDQRDIPKIWNGERVTSRYRLKNSTIIRMLNITPEDQQFLKVLIAKPEKDRRRIERRRKAGVIERAVFLKNVEDRKLAILELSAKGMSAKDIADGHGITKRRVNQIIREAHPDMFDVLKPKS